MKEDNIKQKQFVTDVVKNLIEMLEIFIESEAIVFTQENTKVPPFNVQPKVQRKQLCSNNS